MEKAARRIILGFLIFLTITAVVVMHEYDAFLLCLMKGSIVAIVIIPLLCNHYGDETKYKFHYL